MRFNLKQLVKLFHTLKYLKFKQVYYRFYNKFKKPTVTVFNLGTRNKWHWDGPSLNSQSILNANKVVFLNKQATIEAVGDWNSSEHSKLWLYNLHYFDDLSAYHYQSRELLHYQFIDRWIEENPPCIGNGWEPYPLSLRLVNWVKWFSKKDTFDAKYLSSIAQQSQALMQQIEYHILGNHLFANAKALTFVGAFLMGQQAEKCLQKGLELLDHELQEQFLTDGAHFELSPMYHCILLWDLLELIHLGQLIESKYIDDRTESWKAIASSALTWLTSMIHTDGDISFFNDAAIGVANSPHQIFSYAKSLGLIWDELDKPLVVNQASGYSKINRENYSLIFDHAKVTHTRKLHSTENSFEVKDLLSAPVNSCFHLHIHPNVKPSKLDGYTIKLTLKSNKVVYFKSEQPVELVPSSYHPNFGVTIASYKIIIPFSNGSLLTRVEF